ncbi:MAG: hypothetical protein KAT28_04340 [Candidatus Aenigmarchaeota archaeon]|nr:hypothetical protein [Candidatus Aenigmarchaeota archaeon]
MNHWVESEIISNYNRINTGNWIIRWISFVAPEEFKRESKRITIVREAVKEGIVI